MNLKPCVYLVCLISFLMNTQCFSQDRLKKNNQLSLRVGLGYSLHEFQGLITSIGTTISRGAFNYTCGMDILRFDYLNLKTVGYNGFAGSMNNFVLLFGPSWNIKNLEVGFQLGGFTGMGRIKHEVIQTRINQQGSSQFYTMKKTSYDFGSLTGVRANSCILYSLSKYIKMGIDFSWHMFDIGIVERKGTSFFGAQVSVHYSIHR